MKKYLWALMFAYAWIGGLALAQSFPDKPIIIVVPYATGGPTDGVARIVGQAVAKELGTPVIVENRPGGASTIGTGYVVRQPADGYTLLMVGVNLVLNPATGIATPYDALRDLTPVSALVSMPNLVAVNERVPASDLKSLIAWIRAQPQPVAYASPGAGTLPHIWGELLTQKYALKMTHVPYKGLADASRAVLAGDVPVLFGLAGITTTLIAQGKLKGIVTPGLERAPGLPDLPTARESGFNDLDAQSFLGLVAPARLPANVRDTLNAAINRALKTPPVADAIFKLGLIPTGGTADAFGTVLAQELARWTAVVKRADIKPAQ